MESTLIPFIPSNLLPLLQIDLLVLEQARKKNAAQHRSGLFFRRVHEVYRLGKEIYKELGWTNEWLAEERERRKAEAFRIQHELEEDGHEDIQRAADREALEHIERLTKLLEKVSNKSFVRSQRPPNLTNFVTRSFLLWPRRRSKLYVPLSQSITCLWCPSFRSSVSKMIHHLHFLPLTTLLQACYARIWVISTTIYAHVRPRSADQGTSTMTAVVGYDDVVRFAHPLGMADPSTLSLRSLDAARAELDERIRFQAELGKGKSKNESSTAEDRELESAQAELFETIDGEGEAGMIDFGTKIERNDVDGGRKKTSVVEMRLRKAPPITSFSQPGSGTSTPVGDRVISVQHTPEGSTSPSRDVQGRPGKPLPGVVAEAGQRSEPRKKKRKSDMDDLFGTLKPKKSSINDLVEVKSEKKRKLVGSSTTEPGSSSSRQAAKPTADKTKPDQETAKAKIKKKKKKADDMDDIFGF